ncbi:alpha/beta fold hydrolase [Nocardia wallacei]|uniref:alpha/beta fold hydrolase n=1 Tax=Nocardia wallacei TaxID=480035 RepID=UPI0024582C70|nr:alpha/beta fold hydrolase [Nocardia wallacei]
MSIVSLAAAADRRATVRAADGVELAVVESGRRTADLTVVLVHGHCASSESWTYVRAELSRRYPDARLVCYDHRGHGESAAAPRHTYSTAAGDLPGAGGAGHSVILEQPDRVAEALTRSADSPRPTRSSSAA